MKWGQVELFIQKIYDYIKRGERSLEKEKSKSQVKISAFHLGTSIHTGHKPCGREYNGDII